MKTSNYFTLKEFQLNNNCPECYSNDSLQLTFKQRITETIFFKAITGDTSHEMHCKNCNTTIYPVRWNDDIERVVAYHERAIVPKKTSWKIKPFGYVFIGIDLLIIIAIVLIMLGVIRF
ncbi:hypothetical protein [Winogradskyella haliclonae]|uniref:Uncharacterized protein n=1 Tax=Winogradskyella haliclonae TaxID=2048558 RepID=A0ABQ2BVR2_9FLAO|nr:hypothetical protein [Winogradskyella haliclonae]GGI55925.1 hypothetical protein GCM10011444_02340 [Winogradskyella haliclonae]